MLFNKKSLVLALACASSIAFAANDITQDNLSSLRGTIDSINGELSEQRASIGSIKSEMQHLSKSVQRQILDELKALQRQNQFLYDSMIAQKEKDGEKMNIKPLRNYDLQTPDGKMLLGEDEYVYVKEANATIEARIDTGATVSSISASNITEFERNNKKWLRFDVIFNDRTLRVEAPFVRQTRLRQSSTDEYSYRPVVRLNVKVGDYSAQSEFNLIDRTKMTYALLIGRTFLTDIAVVDVSRRHIQARSDKDGLIIINADDYADAVKNGVNPNAEYDKIQALNAGGQIATLSSDNTQSLGTDADKSLPAVSNKIDETKGQKPSMKVDAKKKEQTEEQDDTKAKTDKDVKKTTTSKNNKKSSKKTDKSAK